LNDQPPQGSLRNLWTIQSIQDDIVFPIFDKSVLKNFNPICSTDSKYPAFFNFCSAALSWGIETDGNGTQINATLQKALFIKIVPQNVAGSVRFEIKNRACGPDWI